jgi:hypothetical protein
MINIVTVLCPLFVMNSVPERTDMTLGAAIHLKKSSPTTFLYICGCRVYIPDFPWQVGLSYLSSGFYEVPM